MRLHLISILTVCGLGLMGCAPEPRAELPSRAAVSLSPLPPMKSFVAAPGAPVERSNLDIATDFLDLSLRMESGRELPFLTRFEGPIRVAVTGAAPASLERDLAQLLARLRNEADIDIARARSGEEAQIIIDAIPQKRLQRAVPQAACFVVPNVAGWRAFRNNRNRASTDWAKLAKRSKATVIIPSDVSPQEVRDCLHEEVAQAIGPLNDLYRLPNSVFNDDNFHTVLTGFDMLILRAYYAPEVHNGMTRSQLERALPELLARLNPEGQKAATRLNSHTPHVWNKTISAALAAGVTDRERARLAAEALQIARSRGWTDNRLAFSLFVQGRVTLGREPQLAIDAFVQSAKLYQRLYGSSVQGAHVATQMSAFALTSGDYDVAIKMVDEAIPAAREGQNAALLSTLLMIKAQALEASGRIDAARSVRLDALAWGRYGFGAERNVLTRLEEIGSLTPKQG